ncbi:DUF4822 domain-containing protein, partial [Lysinibacillus agricola]|uniref:DUF4822 domain-containing protein n=1 Tax=Lysinibacillus agricola TaxID=2590012 RepID=UPI003C289DCC
ELTNNMFTDKRMWKDANGNEVEVVVEHVPYKDKNLTFTEPDKTLTPSPGTIVEDIDGGKLLADTLWQGTIVLDVHK